ncbi:hypothetical protein HZU83_11230 [Sphaerotilus montanus]|uniref:Uncharacterized protein n=1 Tax=Sphaerotilus montanus TaxID=522889 RepID=A0A7Y9R1S6_9BURK|nr:hypothetical protein [Sphaerotilus montanus]NYG35178.1 hypothetical protein [Sphaerotilus montanus]NZD57260.1 hypothetical protein [Sphaerotilus montanus]
MLQQNTVTKKQLLQVISDLEATPADRVRILGDVGITSLGIGLGAAAAGTAATLAGVTAIPLVTTAASWLGVTAVAATPVGWIIGAALAGGALTYYVSRLIRDGSLSEGRKRELLQTYKERLQEVQRREQAQEVTSSDRNTFITSLREMIEKDAIPPKKAFQLIEAVERGAMPLSQAYSLIAAILQEN